jgi:5-methylcytosine-specific restriction endonuclease McrA
MFPEYDEFMEYIHSPDVRKAFEYLVAKASELTDYRCAPHPHGYIRRNYWYQSNGVGLFAFTVTKNHLLFYFRNPQRTHPDLDLNAVTADFPDAKQTNNGEFKMHIRTLDDAKRIMKLAFGIQSMRTLDEVLSEFTHKVHISAGDTQQRRLQRLANADTQPKSITATTIIFERNPDVVAEVLFRAKGICQNCNKPAPFKRRSDGTPYLEVHHVVPLSNGGEDKIENAVALCPNCHRERHHG